MAILPIDVGFYDLTLVLLLVLSFLLWIRFRRPENFPPGPTPIPIIGNFHNLRKGNFLQATRELRNKYGDIFSLSLGSFWVIIVNGNDNIRELLVKRAESTSDRPPILRFIQRKSKGIIAASGSEWKHQRTFALSKLRGFGFGKRSFEKSIQEEVAHFIKLIEDYNGRPLDISGFIHNSMSNNIMLMTVGRRFEYDDKQFRYFIQLLNENVSSPVFSSVANFTPILGKIPGNMFSTRKSKLNGEKIREFFNTEVKEHQKTFDSSNIRDFIDVYLTEMENQKPEEKNVYTVNQLLGVIGDLFGAGTETSATTIRWAILYLIHNRKIQDKMLAEINDVVGNGRLPSMSDKPNLPYCDAVVQESLRLGNIVPLSIPHYVSSDIYYKQFKIPKNSILIPNLESVAYDETLFPDSRAFKPERFIDANGKACGHEKVLSFSLGRRVCLGEAFARMELFLYLTSLVQRFEFRPPTDNGLPPIEGHFGITYSPKPFEFRAILRN